MRLGALRAVIAKELRLRMRNWRSLLTITLYLAALTAIGLGTMSYLRSQGKNTGLEAASVGPQVFGALAEFQIVLLVFVTPALTAGAIAGEKERQTFDLLLTTRLSAFSIVVGKLLMSLAYVLLLLVLSLPIFAMAFLFGGVSLGQLGLTFLIMAMTAFTIGSMSLLVSALVRRVQIATVAAYLLAFALVLGSGIFANTLLPATRDDSAITGGYTTYFTPPADPSPLAYFSPLASLSTVVTTPFGAAIQIPFLQLPNGLPDEYFNRTYSSQNLYSKSSPIPTTGYVPGSYFSLPAIWPLQMALYTVIILVSLGLAIWLVRPPHSARRRQKQLA